MRDPDYEQVFRNRWIWYCGAARGTENFFDQAHFAFVHAGILGAPSNPGVENAVISREEEILYAEVNVPADKTHAVSYVRDYTVFRPFCIYQHKRETDDRIEAYMNVCTPNSASKTTLFMMSRPELRPRRGEGRHPVHRKFQQSGHISGPGNR